MKILLLALLLAGCASTLHPKTPPPTPAPEHSINLVWPTKELRSMAYEVGLKHPELLENIPADIDSYCPAYSKMPPGMRLGVYVAILGALAKYESNYNPEVSYTESFNDAKGKPVVSRGLLQLSQESANGYGCGITDAKQLHDQKTNLECGFKILKKWVIQDRVISGSSPWRGMARYWSPFRDPKKLEAMRAKVSEGCR